MAPKPLSLRALNRATLARQMILAREKITVPRAVERLLAIQAQWPTPPFVALWSRLADLQRAHLASALHARDLVRATSLRATLHVMSGRDYAWSRSALVPMLGRAARSIGKRAKDLDLDAIVAASHAFLDGGPRLFDEVRDHLAAQFPSHDARALGYAARLLVPLCMEPTDDAWAFPSVARFARADRWLGKPLDDRADARRTFLLRYLAALGPATAVDAERWSGMTSLSADLKALAPVLVTLTDEEGRTLYDLPDAPRPPEDAPAPVRFLPEFDNLVLGHDDRTRVIAREHSQAIFTKNLRVRPTFLVDGFAAGAWEIEKQKRAATIVITPFARLAKRAKDEVAAEGERLARFLDDGARTMTLTFATA